ncbi:MAG: SdiA-regulated domain-containing protein, partial [Prosthecobacter sp.]|nr:SdiA-regulated domain-containing protein [Prosthecobacter sp.]
DTTNPTTFLNTWGPLTGIQRLVGGPGLGMNDSVKLYDQNDNLIFNFTYAAGGFTRSDGSAAAGGHAGASAGGVAAQSAVIDPAFGTGAGKRYRAATAGVDGAYANTSGGSNIGSPGVTGLNFGGGPSITLSLSVTPASFSESAANPAATGTVTRTGSTTAELVVTLNSSDSTEATVPASVTIPVGQASTTFDVTAVDDSFPDGNIAVTLTASASGATPGTFEITVQDDGDVLTTNLMLTEVQSQQAATGVNDYWELTNFGSSAVSLAGYSWHDSGRSASAAAAYKLPAGSSIAAGESVIFTTISPAAFRTWWGIPSSVQVFQTVGAPGLGQNDGVALYDEGGNELFYFSYAAGGFKKADGTDSTGGHAGRSAGGSADTQAAVWVPSSGATNPRYTFAVTGQIGCFSSAANTADIGSPGVTVGAPTVDIASASVQEGNSGTTTLTLNVTRSDTSTAFTVDYAVTGGTATSGSDYVALTPGTLTFTAGGPATLPIQITVLGDTASEPDETILVTLSNLVNSIGSTVLGTATGTGTILNDDILAPVIVTEPADVTIASGYTATLSLAATGTPTPTVQWYRGTAGDTTHPVGTGGASFTTPALTATTSYWARVSNAGGSTDSRTATVTVTTGPAVVDLSTYVRVGRYNLPEYRRTPLPPGTASHNLLCDEASAVTYNWDTDTLFITGDGGRAVTQVTKTGQLVDTMSLELSPGKPQGVEFYDPEGITYIGNGEFVLSEERERRLVKFTYAAGTTLTRAATQTVKIGTFDDNTGTEGLSWDPQTSGYIVLKEKNPIGVFQTGIDFAAGTATNGSPTTVNSVNLFNTALLGMTDVADVFALSNLPSMSGQAQEGNLLVLGQEDARVVNISRTGVIHSTLQIVTDSGNPLSAADQQHEGITMDRAGNIYIVNENGGGSIEFPQLWVYAPSSQPNQPPTALALNNAVNSIQENTSTASPIKLGDIVITDDGLGNNVLDITGPDAASFQITGSSLFLRAGVVLDYETKTSYNITLTVDDASVGTTPDATLPYTLTVIDQVVETPPAPALIITEVAPWASGNGAVGGDWFEVTNVSENAVDITGWKMDDNSNSFASSVALNGITSIAPGESVIFIESTVSNQATIVDTFKTVWFGSNVPSGLQIGTYQGSGVGLGTGGDAVNLYTAAGVLHSRVSFGAADNTSPYQTFDNTAALNEVTLTLFSQVGVNGAFVAATSSVEIGSPGYSAPGILRITEVAPWSSGNSPVGADWFEVTNIGARAVNVTGWKMDDSSESPAAAVPMSGITSIAPGESVIFLETANLTTARNTFLSNWFGANPPANLQVGAYTGGGVGLSTGGDAVNLYDTNNVRRVSVSFGVSPSSAPFRTFENAPAADVVLLTTFSTAGVNGAFQAVNSSTEVGSPGQHTLVPPVVVDYTLQLLHLADGEAGLLASQTAPNLAALVDAFDGSYPNTIILAGGDNYIPGPFAAAGTDPVVAATHNKGNNPFAADIEIHNRLGVEASTIGNHEFDFGTNAFADAVLDAEFPYLSANLDFSADSGISGRYLETVGVGGLEEASGLKQRIVPSCVITRGGQKIGLVGATTQILRAISSAGNVQVKGNPSGDDMALLAAQLQPVIDDLKNQGVNKIILMAHLQQIANELMLAPMLRDVDIVLAAGSNTRLGDADDVAVAFPGHAANFAGNYPIYTAGADGKPCVVVNTDNEYTYLGRLVVDFDADGTIIVPNLQANTAINGAYASTPENVAAAWGVPLADLATTAFAPGTKGARVKQITDAVQGVINAKDGDVRGYTTVYLEGERNFVRNQETNLGNLSADSMVTVGKTALPSATHVVALKNGGGIRAAIGAVEVGSGAKLPPIANPGANKPAGAISLLDIENSMRFNNGLMLCETTPAGLKAILEHGVAALGGQGRFPQIGGMSFSFDSSLPAGSRVRSVALTDLDGNITAHVVVNGNVVADAPTSITVVTLNFLANGGDSYPFKANADDFRYLLNGGTLSGSTDESLNFTAAGVVPPNILGEQAALSSHLQARHATPATAYTIAETPIPEDTRIQQLQQRTDTVLLGGPITLTTASIVRYYWQLEAQITLTRTGSGPASVRLRTADGTASSVPPFAGAVAGVDYTAVDTRVEFAAGELSKTITLTLLPQFGITQNRRFTVSLSEP